MGSKLNHLLSSQPHGTVFLSSRMTELGYSHDLQQRYKKSNWLKSIGTGAYIRNNDTIAYEGGVYSLQQHNSSTIHPGGRTALSLLGKSHYLELSAGRIVLFGDRAEKLPTWFENYDWGVKLDYHESSFLP